MKIVSQDRVYLPFRNASGVYSTGIITHVEPHRFRVTWDFPDRKPGESRLRTWHASSEIARFRPGLPGPDPQ